MSEPPEQDWVEFLDDPQPPGEAARARGEDGAPSPRGRSPHLVVGGLVAAALLVLVGTRLVHGGGSGVPAVGAAYGSVASASAPAWTASAAARACLAGDLLADCGVFTVPSVVALPNGTDRIVEPPPGASTEPVPGSGRTWTALRGAGDARASAAVAAAIGAHLDMTVSSLSSVYGPAGPGQAPPLQERHVEADNGSGTHLIIEITTAVGPSASDLDPINAGAGATAVHAFVQNGNYAVSLTAVGPTADVPSQVALESLGADPSLVAV
ncbi:MAG: hypothetical protein EPN43_02810 [Jatrophihabitans sp.]|nr:MAG: hypothetical protein EPN43_02810 [Jatrophihabitans sp.]